MKFTISKEAFKKHKIDPDVGFYLLAQYFGAQPTDATLRKASAMGYLVYGGFDGSVISQDGINAIESALLEGEFKSDPNQEDRYDLLAQKLREIYPKGHKPGTGYMWRDSNPIIANKLRALKKKFGGNWTDEDAINATKRYVASFQGDNTYMQLLKYFILKRKDDGEFVSQLLSYMENTETDDITSEDWTSTLR